MIPLRRIISIRQVPSFFFGALAMIVVATVRDCVISARPSAPSLVRHAREMLGDCCATYPRPCPCAADDAPALGAESAPGPSK